MAHYPSFTHSELERALYIAPGSPGVLLEVMRRHGESAAALDDAEIEIETAQARADALEIELSDAEEAHEELQERVDELLAQVAELGADLKRARGE